MSATEPTFVYSKSEPFLNGSGTLKYDAVGLYGSWKRSDPAGGRPAELVCRITRDNEVEAI